MDNFQSYVRYIYKIETQITTFACNGHWSGTVNTICLVVRFRLYSRLNPFVMKRIAKKIDFVNFLNKVWICLGIDLLKRQSSLWKSKSYSWSTHNQDGQNYFHGKLRFHNHSDTIDATSSFLVFSLPCFTKWNCNAKIA